ncbi:MAG: hypothetical protein J7M15_02815 [Anaerolineae bacterium]|nr:hypothetical protein [Anaerolineae bacterium]
MPGNHITVELALPNLIGERWAKQGDTITVDAQDNLMGTAKVAVGKEGVSEAPDKISI